MTPDEINFNSSDITGDKEGQALRMIQRSVPQEYITITNVYVPNNRTNRTDRTEGSDTLPAELQVSSSCVSPTKGPPAPAREVPPAATATLSSSRSPCSPLAHSGLEKVLIPTARHPCGFLDCCPHLATQPFHGTPPSHLCDVACVS